jgi:3-dehydroquinate synthase
MIKLPDYKIVFETQQFSGLRSLLSEKNYAAIVLLVDENTASFCLPLIQDALKEYEYLVVRIQSGESYKTLDTCQYIWKRLMHNKLTRKSVLINLGGGVIGDMGGFCAATFKRGIDFVQVPTTLLAQVDASVGGKLGVDFNQLKNGVGLFANPQLVCLYPLFFQTLPFEQLRSGFAEVIKHALISDLSYWQQIVTVHLNTADWLPIVRQSVMIKQSIVEKDPTEKGCRKILNFGHTIGHAIESLSWDTSKPLLHGEAVALGMIAEAYISNRLLGLSEVELNELTAFIKSIYPFYSLSAIAEDQILELIKQDKKKERKSNAFSLITAIGKASYNHHVEDALILESLLYYQRVYQSTI